MVRPVFQLKLDGDFPLPAGVLLEDENTWPQSWRLKPPPFYVWALRDFNPLGWLVRSVEGDLRHGVMFGEVGERYRCLAVLPSEGVFAFSRTSWLKVPKDLLTLWPVPLSHSCCHPVLFRDALAIAEYCNEREGHFKASHEEVSIKYWEPGAWVF